MSNESSCSYEVFNPQGDRVMYGSIDVRYPAHVERSLQEAGYEIRYLGKPIKSPKRGRT